MMLVERNKSRSIADLTGPYTDVWSVTDVSAPTTKVGGGKRVRTGRFLTLNYARSEMILTLA